MYSTQNINAACKSAAKGKRPDPSNHQITAAFFWVQVGVLIRREDKTCSNGCVSLYQTYFEEARLVLSGN